jgi:tetratricopeptide (TPR) repeat protein
MDFKLINRFDIVGRLIVLCILICYNISFAQDVKSQKTKKNIPNQSLNTNLHLKVYRQSIQTGDLNTAIVSLNYYLIETNNKEYKDTLALMYAQNRQYDISYKLVKEIQESGGSSDLIIEILAVSANALNQTVEAADAYQKLYSNSKNIQHGYALLQLQQQLKRVNEAQITCNSLMADTTINQVSISVLNEKNKKEINVPFRAVLYNINGLLEYENKAYMESVESFKKALELAPEYEIAAQNLKTITAIKESIEKIKTE